MTETKTKAKKATTPVVSGLVRPATLDRLKSRKRATEYVQVRVDSEAVAELDKLTNEVEAIRVLDGTPPDDLLERLEAARAAVDESTVEMKLVSIGRKAYDALEKEHPPTDEQREEFRADQIKQLMAEGKSQEEAEGQAGEPPYDADTFPVALIAACCVQPELTVEDTQGFYDEWNFNEWMALWMAAVRVHNISRVGYWGKASG